MIDMFFSFCSDLILIAGWHKLEEDFLEQSKTGLQGKSITETG